MISPRLRLIFVFELVIHFLAGVQDLKKKLCSLSSAFFVFSLSGGAIGAVR
jgi:hypothetical protein